MKGMASQYDVVSPKRLDEALSLLSQEPGRWKPLAGGTDLMVLFEAGKLSSHDLINLSYLSELKGIQVSKDSVRIGALTTYTQIREHKILNQEFNLLVEAAKVTGSIAIQNRGTIGGNLANASPAADSPPALLVYDAIIEVQSSQGVRQIPKNLFKSYRTLNLNEDELITAIILPRKGSKGVKEMYRKVGPRQAQAISKICFAGRISLHKQQVEMIKLVFGSVAPIPIQCQNVETVLKGKRLTNDMIEEAIEALQIDISPIDDVRSTSAYRSRVAKNILKQFLSCHV